MVYSVLQFDECVTLWSARWLLVSLTGCFLYVHVSFDMLHIAPCRLDDTSKWREQASQFILAFLFKVRDVIIRLRAVILDRANRDASTADNEGGGGEEGGGSTSSLVNAFSDCDLLLPAAEVIAIMQSPEIESLVAEQGRNIAHCLRLSSDSTVPRLQRRQSNRAQEHQKTLIPDQKTRAFDLAEEKRLQTHQMGLKYIVASGETGCVWIDHFLYLACELWYKGNGVVEAARKCSFAQFAQDSEGRMDLGDFASMIAVVSPDLSEFDVAHLFMQLVDLEGRVDVEEWLQVLSLYEAGLGGGGGTFLPDEPTTYLDHEMAAGDSCSAAGLDKCSAARLM